MYITQTHVTLQMNTPWNPLLLPNSSQVSVVVCFAAISDAFCRVSGCHTKSEHFHGMVFISEYNLTFSYCAGCVTVVCTKEMQFSSVLSYILRLWQSWLFYKWKNYHEVLCSPSYRTKYCPKPATGQTLSTIQVTVKVKQKATCSHSYWKFKDYKSSITSFTIVKTLHVMQIHLQWSTECQRQTSAKTNEVPCFISQHNVHLNNKNADQV